MSIPPRKPEAEEAKEHLCNMADEMLKLNDKGSDGLITKVDLYRIARQEIARVGESIAKYENLVLVALLSPESDCEGAPSFERKINAMAQNCHKRVMRIAIDVSTERKGEADENYLGIAEKCLENAAQNGDERARETASRALRLLFKREIEPVVESYESVMDIGELREIFEADRQFLRTQYPDPTTPQNMFTEQVFDAVKTIITKYNNGQREKAEVAIKQVSSIAGNGMVLEEFFGEFERSLIQRNIENALLYAFVNGTENIKREAEGAILRTANKRMKEELLKIADRCGKESELGEEAQLLASQMLFKGEYRATIKSVPPVPPRRPTFPPPRRARVQ